MLQFLADHQQYIVLGVVLIVWAGILAYLMRLDARVKALEKQDR
jgi:CcmD family protein